MIGGGAVKGRCRAGGEAAGRAVRVAAAGRCGGARGGVVCRTSGSPVTAACSSWRRRPDRAPGCWHWGLRRLGNGGRTILLPRLCRRKHSCKNIRKNILLNKTNARASRIVSVQRPGHRHRCAVRLGPAHPGRAASGPSPKRIAGDRAQFARQPGGQLGRWAAGPVG